MKLFFALLALLLASHSIIGQSGRRGQPLARTTPSPTPQPTPTSSPTPSEPSGPMVTAEKNEDYSCTDDGSLLHIIRNPDEQVPGYLPKQVDTKAEIIERPEPHYTKEGRQAGVQGNVVLKVLLGSSGQIDRVRVVRGLPFGLTAAGIQAACKIKFKAAVKGGQNVPMWLTVEYAYRLARSSIYGP
jgi:periplasmic protein TonB